MSEDKVTQQVVIHSVNFDTFKVITNNVNVVDLSIIYQLPSLAKSWKDKPEEFLQMIIDYYSGEEQWRLKRENKQKVNPAGFTFGTRTLTDAELILAVPTMNSFFIIPGEESIKNNGWNPAEVVQLTNMVSYMPMLLTMSNEPNEDETFKLGTSYKLIQAKQNESTTN